MKRLVAGWLVLMMVMTPCFAQKAVNDWQAVRSLAAGDGISVETAAGEKFHGAFIAATQDSVVLESDEKGGGVPGRRIRQRTVAQADVKEIRHYNRSASIFAGTGIGGAVGAGIGAGIDLSAKSDEDKGLATAVFTVLGALLGALIGRHAVIIHGGVIYRRSFISSAG
jgi:hypothetical protein